MNILNLPPEIILMIFNSFQFENINDIRNFTFVCKIFFEYIKTNTINYTLNENFLTNDEWFQLSPKFHINSIKNLHISCLFKQFKYHHITIKKNNKIYKTKKYILPKNIWKNVLSLNDFYYFFNREHDYIFDFKKNIFYLNLGKYNLEIMNLINENRFKCKSYKIGLLLNADMFKILLNKKKINLLKTT